VGCETNVKEDYNIWIKQEFKNTATVECSMIQHGECNEIQHEHTLRLETRDKTRNYSKMPTVKQNTNLQGDCKNHIRR